MLTERTCIRRAFGEITQSLEIVYLQRFQYIGEIFYYSLNFYKYACVQFCRLPEKLCLVARRNLEYWFFQQKQTPLSGY